jgi:predicted alpha/beta-hydrolase family hydrolase
MHCRHYFDKDPNKMRMILSHGMESGPNASKITRLDEMATAQGYQCTRPDYGTQAKAPQRIEQLLHVASQQNANQPLVLVGSSMGAYISAMASVQIPVAGLFLMAPPVFCRGLEPALRLRCEHVTIVHPWNDELIDADEVFAFARAYKTRLIMVDDSHRLTQSMPALEHAFAEFLNIIAPSVQS